MLSVRIQVNAAIFRECIYKPSSVGKLDRIREQYHAAPDDIETVESFWRHCLIHNGKDFVMDQIKKEFLYQLSTPNTDQNSSQISNIFCGYLLQIFASNPN
eukprot:301303_1